MRNLCSVLLSIALLAAWPGHVAAHAVLERSQPADGALLTTSPTQVQLWFSRAIEPSFSKAQVLDQNGKEVSKGNAAVNANEAKLLEVGVPTLPPGVYKVVWRIVALDGHKAKGEFSFTVK